MAFVKNPAIVHAGAFALYPPGSRKGNKYWLMRATLDRPVEINTYAANQEQALIRARQLIASYNEELREGAERAIIDSECLVYFISDGMGHIKIGSSTDPLARLRDLQVGAPRKLVLLGVMPGDDSIEKTLHGRFGELRQSGEWFLRAPSLTKFIREHCLSNSGAILGRRNSAKSKVLKFNAN